MPPALTLAAAGPNPKPGHSPSRVYVVSPHPLERSGLRALLERAGGANVALELPGLSVLPPGGGVATPDVVLMDLDAGGVNGVRQACAIWKGVPVIVLVSDMAFDAVRELIFAGARGVLSKDDTAEQLATAVSKIQEHELWLDRATTARLIDELATTHAHEVEPDPRIASLTEREVEVVDLVAQGRCNKSIAGELGISDNTVRHHLTSIFGKLGVHDRLALAVFALRNVGGHAKPRTQGTRMR